MKVFEIQGIPDDNYYHRLPSGWELSNDERSVIVEEDEDLQDFVTGYAVGYYRYEYGNPNKISTFVIEELFRCRQDALLRAQQLVEEAQSEEGEHEYYPATFFMNKVT